MNAAGAGHGGRATLTPCPPRFVAIGAMTRLREEPQVTCADHENPEPQKGRDIRPCPFAVRWATPGVWDDTVRGGPAFREDREYRVHASSRPVQRRTTKSPSAKGQLIHRLKTKSTIHKGLGCSHSWGLAKADMATSMI